jgi:hypothetical protein
MYVKYIHNLHTEEDKDFPLLLKYIFLLELVSIFDSSIVEFFDGLCQYLYATLNHLYLLFRSPLFWYRWLIATLKTDVLIQNFPKPLPSIR